MSKSKKRTPEQWQVLFEEHQTSGLTAAEFCRRNDIHPKTFSAHKAPWNKRPKTSTFLKIDTQTSIPTESTWFCRKVLVRYRRVKLQTPLCSERVKALPNWQT